MPITTRHKDYTAYLPKWTRCRHAIEGEDRVKAEKETYLPRLSGQTDKEYTAYLARAFYFNATGRTVDGLTGLIFRKEPVVIQPDVMKPITDDITTEDISLHEFAEMIVEESISVGRTGILADYPETPIGEVITKAERERQNLRPYLSFYRAESIIDWRSGRVNNRYVLTQVRLSETYPIPDKDDEFSEKSGEQIRVLSLKDGVYTVRIFRKETPSSSTDTDWKLFKEYTPEMNNKPLDFIPFFFVGVKDSSPAVEKPPVLDLAELNLSHFRTIADLENGRHWTGVPTPVFIGDFITEDGEDVTDVKLGSEQGIHLASGGDAKYLEFTGQGLEALRNAAKDKEEMMAVLGARILAAEKRMVEAAETARIHRAGETSVLASIANACSKVLTKALEVLRDWAGLSGEVSIQLNTDYLPESMDPQMLTAIIAGWQKKAYAWSDMIWLLKRGEMMRPERNEDEIRDEIAFEGPALGTIGRDEETDE